METNEQNYRPFFKHLRDEKNIPFATICLMPDGKEIGVGASVTSDADQFEYKKGRQIAVGRAIKALHKKASGDLYAYFRQYQAPQTKEEIIALIRSLDINYKNKKLVV